MENVLLFMFLLILFFGVILKFDILCLILFVNVCWIGCFECVLSVMVMFIVVVLFIFFVNYVDWMENFFCVRVLVLFNVMVLMLLSCLRVLVCFSKMFCLFSLVIV